MSIPTLREILLNELYVINQLVENGGELTDELAAMFSITEEHLAEKVDGYKNVIERLDKEVELLKERAAQITIIADALDASKDKLKNHLKEYMIKTDKKELCGYDWRYVISDSKPKVEIFDEDKIPAKFTREKVIHELDKTLIAEAISKGESVEGARLIYVKTLKQYANTKGKK